MGPRREICSAFSISFAARFRIELFRALRYFCPVENDRHERQEHIRPIYHLPEHRRPVLARDAYPRSSRRRQLRAGRALDAYLLPPFLPSAPAVAPERAVLQDAGRSGKTGLPALPPLQAQ